MKFARDQEFYWRETHAFARARAASAPRSGKLGLTAMFSLMFAAPLLFVNLPETAEDVLFFCLFATTAALLVAYVLIPLTDNLPSGVMIASNRIVVGQSRILLKDIASALVGTTRLKGSNFPVLALETRDGRSYLVGLSPKVNPHKLSQFLQRAGVLEPQA